MIDFDTPSNISVFLQMQVFDTPGPRDADASKNFAWIHSHKVLQVIRRCIILSG